MELCSLGLKDFVFIFRPQILISLLELGIPVFCILINLRTGLLSNNGSIPDSGNIYISYLKFPD